MSLKIKKSNSDGPYKKSMRIRQIRTSISLERSFHEALQDVANSERTSIPRLVEKIELSKQSDSNLSSAIRVYVLKHYIQKQPQQ
jgi:predicted DNA-binding ribbon-helix-helix protein